MARAPKDRSPKARGSSVLGVFLLLALLAFLTVHIAQLRGKIQTAQQQEQALSAQVEAQKQQNAALEAGLEKADDEEYLQELAREQLGMVSPGEKVFHDVSN